MIKLNQYILIFLMTIPNSLFSGTGTIQFENKTNYKIFVKIETTNNKEYKETINPNGKWTKTLSKTFGTPDISKMYVKFDDNSEIEINGYRAKSDDLDYRKWSNNINVKNNKKTFVIIDYDHYKNRFERMVSRENKIKERYNEKIGSPVKTIMMLKNETNEQLTIYLKLANSDWIKVILNPKTLHSIKVRKSYGAVTKDLNHMTVEFTNPEEAIKHEIKVEKRWWPNTVNNKKKQLTIIKINYDKVNSRFTRTTFRKGKTRESLTKNLGIKFNGSYLELPVQPKKRQLEIQRKIAEIAANIKALELEKISVQAAKKTAYYALEATKLTALGLSNLAEKATTGSLSLINIKKAEFSGSIKAISKGEFPKLHIDYEILGHPKKINIQFNIKNPSESLKSIGENINPDADKIVDEVVTEEETNNKKIKRKRININEIHKKSFQTVTL